MAVGRSTCVSASGELEADTEDRKDDDDDDPELKKLRAGLSGLSINTVSL